MPFKDIDLLVDEDGDLVLDNSGDIDLADEQTTLLQDVLFRLKTDHLDYAPSPFIGADLSSSTGEPNNTRTCNLATEKAFLALTQDNRVPASVLFVDTIPTGLNVIQVLVSITDSMGDATTPLVATRVINLEPSGPGDESILNRSS